MVFQIAFIPLSPCFPCVSVDSGIEVVYVLNEEVPPDLTAAADPFLRNTITSVA